MFFFSESESKYIDSRSHPVSVPCALFFLQGTYVKLGLVRTGENGIIYKVSLISAIYYDSKMRKS